MAYSNSVDAWRWDTNWYFEPGTNVPKPGMPKPTITPSVKSLSSSDSFTKSDLRRAVPDPSGWRQPLPYSLTARERVNWKGKTEFWSYVGSAYDQLTRWEGNLYANPYIPVPDISVPSVTGAMINRAETEAKLKLKDQNVNYAVALAEAKKSLGLIGDSTLRLFEAYSAARRGRWKKVLTHLKIPRHRFKTGTKDVSARWLELQYGWLPLLSDIHNAHQDARQGIIRHEMRLSVQRTIKSRLFNRRETNEYGFRWDTVQDKSVYGVKVRLDYTLRNTALATASKIGVLNPATVAWELVPFSFVADWIVPIGDWVNSFDADFGLTFVAGTRTTFVRVTRSQKGLFFNPGRRGKTFKSGDCVCSFRYFDMTRTVYTSTPIPLPYWKNPISTSHALNAIALLRGLLK